MLAKVQKKIERKAAQIAQIPAEMAYQLELRRHARQLPQLNAFDQQIVDACKKEGVYVTSLEALGFASSATMLQAARHYLDIMESIRPKQSLAEYDPNQLPQAIHPHIFTVTDLPEFTAWGQETRLLNIVENYIGLPIAFQGVHLRRDFANPSPVTTEFWHQDLEDRRMLKAIIYLSDVEENDGPFEYIPKSQVSPLLAQRIHRRIGKAYTRSQALGITDTEMETLVPRSKWKRCTGPAGTVVLMDPKNIFHHGKSRRKERASLFYVYTAAKPLRPEHCTQYSDASYARPEFVR
jgi:hypothetical protein